MAKLIMHLGDKAAIGALLLKDKNGNTATPASTAWSLSADGVVAMTTDPNGLSSTFAPQAVGGITIDVLIEGDPTPGVNTIHATGEIQVVADEVATAELDFTQGS